MSLAKKAIYARVSTQEQADEGFSIESQIDVISKSIIQNGDIVYDIYIDRGISGKAMDNRPELQRMLSDAKHSRFDEVIVWKVNRLGRNHLELLKIVQQLERYNVDFRSHTEPFDTTTPTGKLMFSMIASIGQFERETIVENVKAGMKQRASQGLFNGGRMLGYYSEKVADERIKSKLVIIPEEADIVRMIFDMYINGFGFKKISNKINDFGFRTINGNLFSIYAVRDIVMNPTYAGFIRYNNRTKNRKNNDAESAHIYKGQHDPIITEEIWNQAQAIMQSRAHGPRKVHKGVFLLTGLLKCPECGSSMVAGRSTHKRNGKKVMYHYYQCSRYKNYGRNACKPNSIRQEYAEKYVVDKLNKFTVNDEFIERVISKLNSQSKTKSEPLFHKLTDLERSKSKCDVKRERILDLYESGDIDKVVFRERINRFEEDVDRINTQIKEIKKELEESKALDQIPTEYVKLMIHSFSKIFKVSNRDQRKVLLNLIIDKITVGSNKKINEIVLHFDENTQKYLVEEDSTDNVESSIFMHFKLTI